MDVPLRKSYTLVLLFLVVVFVIHHSDGNPLPSNLLKGIATLIDRYEKGELTARFSIYYYHDDEDQQSIEAFFTPGIILWDPLFQYFNGELRCPQCDQILKPRSWKDGRDWKHDNPRQLSDLESTVLLVSRVYACKNDHRTVGHDPHILKQFTKEELIPFVLLHKNGITRRLYRMITVQTASGMT